VQPAAADWSGALAKTVTQAKSDVAAAVKGPTGFHVLNEVLDPATKAPLKVQIDGKTFEAAVTELPKRGTAETWQIINTTVDAHPMHLHLVQFQVVSRQKFRVNQYVNRTFTFAAGNPQPTILPIDPTPYTYGALMAPLPQETGFKDTAISYPGEVLTVIAKWDGRWCDGAVTAACPAGSPTFQAVTSGPYVWHCHIVDHEDNEMMRPTLVMP
jgi:FtsP/CotA-like multicopper oxidase with cupredoxin domain